jgi:RNase P subunit RPR2
LSAGQVEDVADRCDECGEAIAYDETCYARMTGREIDGLPVIAVVCHACHWKAAEQS